MLASIDVAAIDGLFSSGLIRSRRRRRLLIRFQLIHRFAVIVGGKKKFSRTVQYLHMAFDILESKLHGRRPPFVSVKSSIQKELYHSHDRYIRCRKAANHAGALPTALCSASLVRR
jgi:hypothetical protein